MSFRITPVLNDEQGRKFVELANQQGTTPNQLAKRICLFYIKLPLEAQIVIGQILSQESKVEESLKNVIS